MFNVRALGDSRLTNSIAIANHLHKRFCWLSLDRRMPWVLECARNMDYGGALQADILTYFCELS